MREILFRGRTDDGEWIYGGFYKTETITFIISEKCGGCFIVEPETVSQYTGLKDRNEAKIFEGDRVNYYTTRWVSESACDLFGVDGENEFDAGGEVHRKYTGEIRFFPSVGFVIANVKMREVHSDGEYAHQVPNDEWGKENKMSYKIMSETKTRCEIIGNIHEESK